MENGITLILTHQDEQTKKVQSNLWRKIKTFEDKKWTKKYHDPDPNKKSFGRVVIRMKDGKKIEDEISVADAHPSEIDHLKDIII